MSYMVRKLLLWLFLGIFSKIFCFENMSARIFTTLRVSYVGEILDSLLLRCIEEHHGIGANFDYEVVEDPEWWMIFTCYPEGGFENIHNWYNYV